MSRAVCILTHDIDSTEVRDCVGLVDDDQGREILDIDASGKHCGCSNRLSCSDWNSAGNSLQSKGQGRGEHCWKKAMNVRLELI